MPDAERPDDTATHPAAAGTAHGPGRVLVGVYGLFVLAAGARAGVQIATRFDTAPVAYLLSGFAALVYLGATVALARSGYRWWLAAVVCCSTELVGVLVVGVASRLMPDDFPDATVWSNFGSGYGFVPLVLPVLGLFWLRKTRPER
jgi:hypothetical protein